MMLAPSRLRSARFAASAFSLIELMVAVGLMSVIVFALYAIFDQTQKALRASLQQSEMNESARPAMDLMVRDIERAEALGLTTNTANFMTRFTRVPTTTLNLAPGARFTPQLQSIFFFGETGQHRYHGLGFYIGNETNAAQNPDPTALVGTLYKFEDTLLVTNRSRFAEVTALSALQRYYTAAANGRYDTRGLMSSRLVEGVVHFRVVPADTDGLAYDYFTYPVKRLEARTNEVTLQNADGFSYATFKGGRVPAFVEIELGVLDSKTLDQYRSIPNAAQALNFLNRNAGKVQIFRQRVALRSALQ